MDSIILDIDGTLWDSTELVAEAWNQALAEKTGLKKHIRASQLKKLFGKPMEDIFKELFPGLTPEEYDQVAEICCQAESEALQEEGGELYPGVAETLPLLCKKHPLYIVSNCQKGYIEDFLRNTGLGDCFSGWLCYGDTKKSKGQTLLALMKQYDLKNPIYVGDTMGDALACYEARIPFVWVSYGFGDVDESCYARKVVKFQELLEA